MSPTHSRAGCRPVSRLSVLTYCPGCSAGADAAVSRRIGFWPLRVRGGSFRLVYGVVRQRSADADSPNRGPNRLAIGHRGRRIVRCCNGGPLAQMGQLCDQPPEPGPIQAISHDRVKRK